MTVTFVQHLEQHKEHSQLWGSMKHNEGGQSQNETQKLF